jgi:hypothetical protein
MALFISPKHKFPKSTKENLANHSQPSPDHVYFLAAGTWLDFLNSSNGFVFTG